MLKVSVLSHQATAFKNLQSGDLTDIITKVLNPNIDIQAPVFFSNMGGPQSAITQTSALFQLINSYVPSLGHLDKGTWKSCTNLLFFKFSVCMQTCLLESGESNKG